MVITQQIGRTLSLLTIFMVALLFSVSLVGAFSLFGSGETKVDSQGAVKVSATLLNPEKEHIISFQLSLDTHSVDLSRYNLEAITALQLDDSPPISGGSWDFSGSGHHFKGTLSFAQPVPAGTKTVRLLIRDLDGVKERTLEWRLPE